MAYLPFAHWADAQYLENPLIPSRVDEWLLLKHAVGKEPQSRQVGRARDDGALDKTGSFTGGGGWQGSAGAHWSGLADGRGVNDMCNKTCDVSIGLAH